MLITVTHLTLRFYIKDGWTEEKVRELLVDKKRKIELRLGLPFSSLDYYAVYDRGGYQIFSKKLLDHTFSNPDHWDIYYYVKD